MTNSHIARLAGCALALATSLATGCKAAEPGETGIRIGDKTLEQFKPGEATEDWVLAVVGQPTTRTDFVEGDEHVAILRYTTVERSGGGLMSLFNGSTPPRTTATIYFIARNGVVTQFWADREQEVGIFGSKKTKDTGEKKD